MTFFDKRGNTLAKAAAILAKIVEVACDIGAVSLAVRPCGFRLWLLFARL